MNMDRSNRTLIIIGIVVAFVVVPVATWIVLSQLNTTNEQPQQSQPLEERTNQEIVSAIVQSSPNLSNNGDATFAISNVAQPQSGWYIATIHTNDDPEGRNPAKVLLYDYAQNGGLKVLLGPGTSFPKDVTQPLGIPDSIAQELNS
jgi:hypothetical protein